LIRTTLAHIPPVHLHQYGSERGSNGRGLEQLSRCTTFDNSRVILPGSVDTMLGILAWRGESDGAPPAPGVTNARDANFGLVGNPTGAVRPASPWTASASILSEPWRTCLRLSGGVTFAF
jgi:hypothetical protein